MLEQGYEEPTEAYARRVMRSCRFYYFENVFFVH